MSAQARWDDLGPSVIEGGFKIGVASDFWNRYEEDILLAKGLGVRRDCFVHARRSIADSRLPLHEHDAVPHVWLLTTTSNPSWWMQKACPREDSLSFSMCSMLLSWKACDAATGSNSFRISIEWARIVPERGVVDEEAVKHYHRIFDQIDACVPSEQL